MVAPAHAGTAALTPPLHFLAISPWPAQLGKRLAFVVAFQHPLRGREPLGDLPATLLWSSLGLAKESTKGKWHNRPEWCGAGV